MNGNRLLVVMFVCVFTVSAVQASAVEYPRSQAAASSELWSASYAIDGNPSTAWSSAYHSSGNAYEYLAFWFNAFYATNYVRITPRTYNGVNQCIPTSIDIYYSGTDLTWHHIGGCSPI